MITINNNLISFNNVCNMDVKSCVNSHNAVLKIQFPSNLNSEWVNSVRYHMLQKIGNTIGTNLSCFSNQSFFEHEYDNLVIIGDLVDDEYTVYIVDKNADD